MSNQAKLVRGQVRQIVKEILPEVLAAELRAELYKNLATSLQAQLKNVEAQVKATLDQLDQRSKDIQGYLVRQSIITHNPADVLSSPSASVSAKTE